MLWQVQCCLLDGLSMSVPWRATSWKYRERDGHWPIYQRVKMWKYGSYLGGATPIYQTVRRIVSWWTAARWSRFTMLVKIFPGKFWSQLEKQNWCKMQSTHPKIIKCEGSIKWTSQLAEESQAKNDKCQFPQLARHRWCCPPMILKGLRGGGC